MLLYRIVHKRYSEHLHASGMKGRWNRQGNLVIYTAESIPLAFLENMVRRQGAGFNLDFKIMIIKVPAKTPTTKIGASDLPEGWRNIYDYAKCQPPGNEWYDAGKTLLLKAPSAVLPEAFNYVINTQHPDFIKVKLAGVTNLVPDERIEELLKNYPV